MILNLGMNLPLGAMKLCGMRARCWWMMRGGVVALLLMVLFPARGWAQRVSVSLFDAASVQSVRITPRTEGYVLLVDGNKYALPSGEALRVERVGDVLRFSSLQLKNLECEHAAVIHGDPEAMFELECVTPAAGAREYDGNLNLYVDFGCLMVSNLVDQELYVAGVVLAEVGSRAKYELYRAQALLVRTYLLSHRDKHLEEGYNLCDEVHCQAYRGSAQKYPTIVKAAKSTQGLVLLDKGKRFVTSVFHANCGGETASAGDVWLTDNDYLRSVRDPYCRKSKGATWTTRVRLADWKRFLHSKGVPTQNISNGQYAYRSTRREAVYSLPGGVGVPFRDLREYFNLKSAWFDVIPSGESLELRGRGYGHGIGLCQEGAMRMAEAGKKAEDIIAFYFHGVRIAKASMAVPADGKK